MFFYMYDKDSDDHIFVLADSEGVVRKHFPNAINIVPVNYVNPWDIDKEPIYLLSLNSVLFAARHVYIKADDSFLYGGRVNKFLRVHHWKAEGISETYEKLSNVYPVYTKNSILQHGDVILSKNEAHVIFYRP